MENINKKFNKSVCVVCKSSNTSEWYKGNADPKKLSFTYEFSPQAKKTFRVVRCNNCTHVFCDPLPKNIYKYYEDVIDEVYLTQEIDRKLTAEVLVKKIIKYKKMGKILDIGCATGDFLEIAKKYKFDTYGLELSKWSSEIANKKGIKTFRESIEVHATRFPKKYDIITLWGVIEHFQNPLDEMVYINRLLKPGGIVVVWTGDVDSITSRLMGRNWWYWLGQHIQYFTRKSLKLLGENSGFRQVFSGVYPQAVTYPKVVNSMGRYRNYKLLLLFFKFLFSIKKVWFVLIPGEIFWIAKEKGDA